MKKNNIYFIAMAAHGVGLSGGDRIAIEFARRWSKKYNIVIYCWDEGQKMWQAQGLKASNITYHSVSMTPWKHFGFLINYVARIIVGIKIAISITIENTPSTIIYSASEFWMDSLPAYILKTRFSKIKWAATWFQTAPNPLKGFAEGKRSGSTYRLNALLYWLSQLPIKPLVATYADVALVNNEDERKEFPELEKKKHVIVVIGAVDVARIEAFKAKHKTVKKVYDAVFQGRFHAQKGVVEMIDIWKKVTDKKPNAILAMIGDGPLMGDVRSKIKDLRLEKNITLLGYVFDGVEKYTTFAQSKLVVHPAFFDSGGMASAEAMAFGLPCVGFNLVSYQSYYPYGMTKVKIGNTSEFAKTVLKLLNDKKLRDKTGKEALDMIQKNWSWDKRATEVIQKIIH